MDKIVNGSLQTWILFLMCMLGVLRTGCSLRVRITRLKSAVAKGAVCLDGSPPAYYFHKGSGAGVNNWLIKLSGGSWCNNMTSCYARKASKYGSSTLMQKKVNFTGSLSNLEKHNPDFYNWNRVRVGYCDGGSFTGDVEEVNSTTKVYFRGARIIHAVIEHLLAKGMRHAENAILAGCSAGGLAVFHHCDSFMSLLPKSTKVKCLADAGFFINVKDMAGAPTIEEYFSEVITTHGSTKSLPVSCTSKMKSGMCFFPENFAQEIKTPIFILNSAIDMWQIKNILAPVEADPYGVWDDCKSNITKCTDIQLQKIQEFRLQFINALAGLGNSTSRGIFINSCYLHCQVESDGVWHGVNTPMLNKKTIARAFSDWFFDKSPFHEIGSPYPDDKTCSKF